MNKLLSTAMALALGAAFAQPVLAQPATQGGMDQGQMSQGQMSQAPMTQALPGPPVASQPVPDTSRESPGIPGDQAVNPFPGAPGPYAGAGRKDFYDIDARIADVSGKIAALPAGQRRKAMAMMHAVKSEEATQRARHGGQLRDWDRENLNAKLDRMVQAYPSLGAQG